jgi:hypothetical protein
MFDIISDGAELVSEHEAARRMDICRGCKFFGEVNPMPLFYTQGCTECGCVLEIKTKLKAVRRLSDGDLTALEIAKLQTEKGNLEIVRCPKGYWEQ